MRGNLAKLPPWTWAVVLTILLVIAGMTGWSRMHFDTSVEALLPEGSEARESIAFLRDSSMAAKAVLWFRFNGEAGTMQELVAAAEDVIARLDKKLVSGVVRPPRESDALAQVIGLLDNAGELLSQDDLKELDAAMQPDALNKRMRQAYMQLARPEGTFLQEIIRRDPLGISTRILQRMHSLNTAIGYRAQVQDGHLVLPDERQLILVLNAKPAATDVAGSTELVHHLNEVIATAPKNVSITPISGHVHTEANDRVMTGDIGFTGIIDGIGFALVFLLVCRDWRVVAVLVVPMLAIATAAGICGWVFAAVSALVIGLAATMAGSAVDYGIHVYTAVREGEQPYAEARRIARPLLTGMLATAGVFVGFVFSGVPAYRQLGAMASGALALAAFFALSLLPAVVKRGGGLSMPNGMSLVAWGRRTQWVAVVTIVIACAGAVTARGVWFDGDVTRLDGSGAAVLKAEDEFQRTWRNIEGDLAMLAVRGSDREDAARRSDAAYREVSAALGAEKLVSLSAFWPAYETRAENLERWRAFWSEQRIAIFRTNLTAAAEQYGFAADAFDPFFQSLQRTEPSREFPPALTQLQQQFFVETGDGIYAMNYLSDDPGLVQQIREIVQPRGDSVLISKSAIGQAFARSAREETRMLFTISGAFIVLSMLVMTGSLKRLLIMMLPALIGLSVMLAVHALAGIPLNVSSVIAAIVVLGLCIDYGVFTVHAWQQNGATLGRGLVSVHLSSVTTLIGTSSLLLAEHPALFSVGLALTTGLAAGYAAAVLTLPAVCYRFMPNNQEVSACDVVSRGA